MRRRILKYIPADIAGIIVNLSVWEVQQKGEVSEDSSFNFRASLLLADLSTRRFDIFGHFINSGVQTSWVCLLENNYVLLIFCPENK